MPLSVHSETGRLRRVLVHRPGREIDWMVPGMMAELLFDDILYGDDAREEHDRFCQLLRATGAETLYAGDLLAEALSGAEARAFLLRRLLRGRCIDPVMAERLELLPAGELARVLVTGLRPEGSGIEEALFDLPPAANYFFQRDPQVVLGDRVLISSMATRAREREPALGAALFRHHPALTGSEVFEICEERPLRSEYEASFPAPTLEGGDVLVPSSEVLLVGVSERTNRHGVEILAEHLRRESTTFRHLLAVELPSRRSYMHLDTVFTFIDRGLCLAYLPVVEPGSPESAHVYRVDLDRSELAFVLRPSLRHALEEVGLGVDLVPCGGGGDRVDQEREQWTDGANAFAVAPGLIFLYERNRRTLDELAARGWRVLAERELGAAGEELLGRGPTVVSISGNELSRARGGPRCMTMPLEREPLT